MDFMARATKRSGTLVLNRRQTGLLVSPARLEILQAFAGLRRASARELAAQLRRPPGAVYHHLRRLEQAGLIAEVERRAGTRRPEAVYAPVAERLAVAAGASPHGDRQAQQTLRAVLRQAARDVDAAFEGGAARLQGRFHGVQLSAALKPRDVKRALGLLARIEAMLRKAKCVRPGANDVIFRWTSVFVPIDRKRP
jgi:DNA-binding transcriptional ArsR family regulator